MFQNSLMQDSKPARHSTLTRHRPKPTSGTFMTLWIWPLTFWVEPNTTSTNITKGRRCIKLQVKEISGSHTNRDKESDRHRDRQTDRGKSPVMSTIVDWLDRNVRLVTFYNITECSKNESSCKISTVYMRGRSRGGAFVTVSCNDSW